MKKFKLSDFLYDFEAFILLGNRKGITGEFWYDLQTSEGLDILSEKSLLTEKLTDVVNNFDLLVNTGMFKGYTELEILGINKLIESDSLIVINKLVVDYYGEVDSDEDLLIANKFKITVDQLHTLRNTDENESFTLIKGKEKLKCTFIYWDENNGYVNYYYQTVNRNGSKGRSSSTIDANKLFKNSSLKLILKEDDSIDLYTDTEPTNKEIEFVKKLGEVKYEYTPGGYPSIGRFKYNEVNDDKLIKFVEKIKTREDIVKYTKAIKSIFGNYSAYRIFYNRAKKLCTENELISIGEYNVEIDLNVRFNH